MIYCVLSTVVLCLLSAPCPAIDLDPLLPALACFGLLLFGAQVAGVYYGHVGFHPSKNDLHRDPVVGGFLLSFFLRGW